MTGWMFFFIFVAFIVGWSIGHSFARAEVARECRLLGRFYVGNTVFECHTIKEKPSAPSSDRDS